MATVLLVRHGRSTANTAGVLAGRAPGVHLDERGREQAARAAERIAELPLAALVSSPARAVPRDGQGARRGAGRADPRARRPGADRVRLRRVAGPPPEGAGSRERLWKTVQSHPSAAGFPGGETLAAMQARAVAAVRRRDAAVEAEHGPGAVWVAVSHGDLIKALLADALGTHLDHFQRLHVDPASISVVRYTETRPYVLGTNTQEGSLAWLKPPRRRRSPPPGRRGRRRRGPGLRAATAWIGRLGWAHACRPPLRPARALRRRHRRRAGSAHLLPAGPRGRRGWCRSPWRSSRSSRSRSGWTSCSTS